MPADEAAKTHSWYTISSKKKAGKVTADIAIFGEIGWEVRAQEFIKELNAIEADSIVVSINSVGGDVFDGVAIYNALRLNEATVTVNVVGLAASAASFIAQAGDEVYMLRGSEMMIHDASAFAWGNAKVMRNTGDILDKISNSIADIYAQRAGGTAEEWRAIMQAEMWYSPEEAVAAGLADKSVDDEDADAVETKNSWDLRVFNFAGRSEAPSPVEETLKIINRAKEAPVTPKITDEGEKVTPDPEAPAAPAAPEAPAAPAEEETPPAEPVAPEAPAAAPVVENRAGVFMVNGVSTSDPKAVQNHITVLETFAKETREAGRKTFIEGLATDNKIAATQIEAIEKLVATMNDEQYGMWAASWEAAPNISLLGSHGDTNGGAPTGTAAATASEEIETLKEIVNRHVMGRMKRELIEATDSYKRLKALEPTFTLDKK